jgi:transcriptional regulator with XRE-family HTH domain
LWWLVRQMWTLWLGSRARIMASAPPRSFADLLRRYRIAAHMPQEELAEQAGLSRRAIGALEMGAPRAPHPDTVSLLADALVLAGDDHTAFRNAARRISAHASKGAAHPASMPASVEVLPRGTVTFLIAAIEGASQLQNHLGAARSAAVPRTIADCRVRRVRRTVGSR